MEAIPQAKAAAKRAVEIDPTLAEGHTFLAYTLAAYDWNWAEAEREFKRAIELDPNNSVPHLRYGQIYLSPLGRNEEAIAEIKRALELEPLSLFDNSVLTATYYFARQPDRALEQGRKTSELDPNFPTGRWTLGSVYNANGMYAEAIELSEKSLQSDPTNQVQLGLAGYAYAKSGRRFEAEEVIRKFREIAKTHYASPYWIAVVYVALGDKDKAFAELEKAFEQLDWNLHRLKVDPLMDRLRDDPRFNAMLKRLNLPE
jgi:tetratricopeptide (TPR) repeat protein